MKVPRPAKSSSPASVEPGVRPLARQAAASHWSWAASVSVMTRVEEVGPEAGAGPGPFGGVGGDVVDGVVEDVGLQRIGGRGRSHGAPDGAGHVLVPSPGPACVRFR